MSASVVAPEDIAALTQKLAEAERAAMVIKAKLQSASGPLATLAALRIESIEDGIATLLESAHSAAEVALSVSSLDPPG